MAQQPPYPGALNYANQPPNYYATQPGQASSPYAGGGYGPPPPGPGGYYGPPQPGYGQQPQVVYIQDDRRRDGGGGSSAASCGLMALMACCCGCCMADMLG